MKSKKARKFETFIPLEVIDGGVKQGLSIKIFGIKEHIREVNDQLMAGCAGFAENAFVETSPQAILPANLDNTHLFYI